MRKIKVKAPEGRACPRELNRGPKIGSTPVDVVDSAYYRGAIRRGELIQIEDHQPVAAQDPAPEEATGSEQTSEPAQTPDAESAPEVSGTTSSKRRK